MDSIVQLPKSWIEAQSGDVALNGTVLEITEEGIVLEVDESLGRLAQDGVTLDRIRLNVDGVDHADLKLTLSQIPGARASVMARAADDRTESILWEASYNRRHKRDSKRDKHEELPPTVPARGHNTEIARVERLDFIREQTGAPLIRIGSPTLPVTRLSNNLESYIGSIEIPVGAAGPLRINGEHARGVFYAPIATTEGALVASITRGAWAFTHAGGINAQVFRQRMMRVPYFRLGSMKQALFMGTWLTDHFDAIRAKAREFSNYADLVEVQPQVQGDALHVHFIYETGDAAGQNMTTTCTWKTCLWILERLNAFPNLQVLDFIIEANLSNDKKVTYQSFIKGRGIHVQADGFLPDKIVKRILKVDSAKLFETYLDFTQGSLQAGMVGFNVNVANVIGGMFTATGQDIASVHECSIAHLQMHRRDGGIYASLTLPSLIIGTVGGGTGLPHQREALEMLNCAGAGNSRKLAEIIASFALSLELSTASAIASGQFAISHEKLGRNRPVAYFTLDQLTAGYFADHMSANVRKAEPIANVKLGSSIVTELSRKGQDKAVGHFPYLLTVDDGGKTDTIEVIVKSKPTDAEVLNMLGKLAVLGGNDLAKAFRAWGAISEFQACHDRELAIYGLDEPAVKRLTPRIHGLHRDPNREIYLIIMERLTDMELMDTSDDVSSWTSEHIGQALKDIAQVHGRWLGRESDLRAMGLFDNAPSRRGMVGATALWKGLIQQARDEFPEWVKSAHASRYHQLVESLPEWWAAIERLPRTLIHNDFNPRNIAFRQVDGARRLCVYDWELATIHLPQHDLAELLIFTLGPDATLDQVRAFVEQHRLDVSAAAGRDLDADDWWNGFRWSLRDLAVNRVAMYLLAHSAKHYGFMERIFAATMHLLDLVEDQPA